MPSFAATADQITIEELRARGSVKWTRGGPGVIGAFVAEMDFGAAHPRHVRLNFATPRPILAEIIRRLAEAAAAG
jgi:bifunctional pyridoxal-dependent enzyme with beta-cystathionase and maltose regulon repressor activities